MVERSLSMREVPGSIPGISKLFQTSNDIFKQVMLTISLKFSHKNLILQRMAEYYFCSTKWLERYKK